MAKAATKCFPPMRALQRQLLLAKNRWLPRWRWYSINVLYPHHWAPTNHQRGLRQITSEKSDGFNGFHHAGYGGYAKA